MEYQKISNSKEFNNLFLYDNSFLNYDKNHIITSFFIKMPSLRLLLYQSKVRNFHIFQNNI